MTVTLDIPQSPGDIPDLPALDAMLRAYMAPMLKRFHAAGGPDLAVDEVLGDIRAGLEDFMPPRGRSVLARDGAGRLVGFGFLKRLPSGAGEMKKLYVDPSQRGTGLGRALVQARIDAAREMGLTRLYADTVTGNAPMTRLYESFGFQSIPRYAENANPPEFAPWLVFFELSLDRP